MSKPIDDTQNNTQNNTLTGNTQNALLDAQGGIFGNVADAVNSTIGLINTGIGNAKTNGYYGKLMNNLNALGNTRVGATTYDDILKMNSPVYTTYKSKEFRNKSIGSSILGGLAAGNQGALAGFKVGGGIGAAIGGILGTGASVIGDIFGGIRARKEARWAGMNNRIATDAFNSSKNNALDAVTNRSFRTALGNSIPHATGGPMIKAGYGADFSNGVNKIATGGTHELNPFGGVPQGVDPLMVPNTVEEGEVTAVIYKGTPQETTYVFNNGRGLTPSKEIRTKYKIPKSIKTYAQAAEWGLKESEEREYDPISKAGRDAFLAALALDEELSRVKLLAKQAAEAFALMDPYQLLAIMQQLQLGQDLGQEDMQGMEMQGSPEEAMMAQPMAALGGMQRHVFSGTEEENVLLTPLSWQAPDHTGWEAWDEEAARAINAISNEELFGLLAKYPHWFSEFYTKEGDYVNNFKHYNNEDEFAYAAEVLRQARANERALRNWGGEDPSEVEPYDLKDIDNYIKEPPAFNESYYKALEEANKFDESLEKKKKTWDEYQEWKTLREKLMEYYQKLVDGGMDSKKALKETKKNFKKDFLYFDKYGKDDYQTWKLYKVDKLAGRLNDNSKHNFLTDLRYAAPLTSLGLGIAEALKKPDYSRPLQLMDLAKQAYNKEAPTIGGYLANYNTDLSRYIAASNAANAAAIRATQEASAGNQGAALQGIANLDYNRNLGLGELAFKAEDTMFDNNMKIAAHNFGIDSANLNSQLNTNLNAIGALLYMQLANNAMDTIDANKSQALSTDITGFTQGLSDIGREEVARDMVESDPSRYGMRRDGAVYYKGGDELMSALMDYYNTTRGKAFGGYIRKKGGRNG